MSISCEYVLVLIYTMLIAYVSVYDAGPSDVELLSWLLSQQLIVAKLESAKMTCILSLCMVLYENEQHCLLSDELCAILRSEQYSFRWSQAKRPYHLYKMVGR